ncbi:cysteine--tRNA ligase [Thauera linaloolentis]|uniref:Cysteine--tRNA ligase n=1 Tax=Thauera linaloolentis (strain DSM 12138 / JCM 21573 / CCUG 41526 / CIP 105981 / IAM 15112 / NBRC 102519 / 47Lol) TaxID=1123367 RepID=N6Y7H2_THAL4|nr:cysteine--tRNA ligase [Thauera linaloolentis]ENO90236.1 cysteinyl-tRNA synthetase [Thauera linaloolentis 47Lol = DSM 12138]MCM8566273.1 cysteine--tRNA ligase [Thauera linaloolentis]
MSSAVRLHNTLTRRKEALRTGQPDRVTMYVCGPTVYNYAHIGNARPAVVFDVLARLLRHHYPQVVYARNFTDVDDKINAAAAAEGVTIGTLTARYIDAYHADMNALGVLAPDLEPRVTGHIAEIIALIEALVARGHAYVAQGHALFHVPSWPDYGRLSGRRTEDMIAGARVEVAPYKRDPMDFVLWKPSTPDLPGWDSPWGRGRPGWHIECSAMIGRHLGHTIDIHGGGQDLIFPHHENEIAQGTCAHGAPYCRTWVHNSFVTVDGQKMSKSLGNVLLVRDLLHQAPGEAIRLALLSAHYRHPLDWSAQRLAAARLTLARFYRGLEKAEHLALPDAAPDDEVLGALGNDLNVPGALARLHVLLAELAGAGADAERAQIKARLLASARLLGLLEQSPETALAALHTPAPAQAAMPLDAAWVEARVAEREQARRQRDFARADALRGQLAEAGVLLRDTPQGSTWALAEETPV